MVINSCDYKHTRIRGDKVINIMIIVIIIIYTIVTMFSLLITTTLIKPEFRSVKFCFVNYATCPRKVLVSLCGHDVDLEHLKNG